MQHTDPRLDAVKRALLAMQRHSWEQGTAAQAFLEAGDKEIVIVMAYEAVNRQVADGRLAIMQSPNAVTDPASMGEALLYAAAETGDTALRQAAQRQLDWLMHTAPRTADGTLHHLTSKPEVWVDSYYMAPPFLAVAGEHVEAVRQIEGMRRILWDPDARLFHHQWSEATGDFVRAAFWGVGNGWAAAGMARVVQALPLTMDEDRQRLIGYIREVLDGCLAHLRPDGLFHDVVDDPSTFIETNLGQMLAYTIYRGVTAGWLGESYLPAAERMRQAAEAKVDAVGLVQGVCAAPRFDRPGFAPEGQAFTILMETAYSDWLGSSR